MSMPTSTLDFSDLKCPPQLPRQLLLELVWDPVVTQGVPMFGHRRLDEVRYQVALRAFPADHIWPIEGLHGTLLQFAINSADVTMVYEAIRLGADVDAKDEKGRTALFHVIQCIVSSDISKERPPIHGLLWTDPLLGNAPIHPNATPRMKMMASLLIEHRADVNCVWNDVSCLTFLLQAKVKHWDTIELLIAHGARESVVTGLHNAVVLLKEEKERIAELRRTQPSKRPPRPCPCFSGRLLSDCHGKGPRPFPYDFFCPCQSGSVYAKCCKRRKLSWRDIWNEDRGIIEPWRKDLPVYLPLPYDTITIWFTLRDQDVMTSPPIEKYRRPTDIPLAVAQTGIPPELESVDILGSCLEDVSRKGSVDPAFVFAMKMVRWNARPLGRKVPKNFAMDLARVFNEHVDGYIVSGQDSRPKLEIEIAAKLGPSCGALYRICEAEGCNKQEGRNLKKLKYCRACRMAVYCSVKCQRTHWKIHKNVCCEPNQAEQLLPSQRVLQGKLSQTVVAMFSAVIHRIKTLEPERFLRLFPDGVSEDYSSAPFASGLPDAFKELGLIPP